MAVDKKEIKHPIYNLHSFCEHLCDGLEVCLERGIKYDGIAFHGIDNVGSLERFRKTLDDVFKSRGLDLSAWAFPRIPNSLPKYDGKHPEKEGYQRVDLGWFIENAWIEGYPNFVLVDKINNVSNISYQSVSEIQPSYQSASPDFQLVD